VLSQVAQDISLVGCQSSYDAAEAVIVLTMIVSRFAVDWSQRTRSTVDCLRRGGRLSTNYNLILSNVGRIDVHLTTVGLEVD